MDIINTNKDEVAIVVVGYNRIEPIQRLLNSLTRAEYHNLNVPLIISIDCSGNEELYRLAEDFRWCHGEKYVFIQENRLGLRKHIYQCMGLSKYFRAIVVLEDDLFVSNRFYDYALAAVEKYENEERVAEIALYKNDMNGYMGLPFSPLCNGSDTFLMQDVCTSGECMTWRMWNNFMSWLDSHSEEDYQTVDMPDTIKGWERAWSKAYNAYVVDSHKYVVYPYTAVTTNFNDVGEHGGDDSSITQVCLSFKENTYTMYDFDELVRYDIYYNNECIYKWLNINQEEIVIDLYGYNERILKKYLLTTRLLPFPVIKKYALAMRPIELNIKYDISGEDIFLYDTSMKEGISIRGRYSKGVVPYFLNGFRSRLLIKEVVKYIKRKVMKQ